MLGMLELEHTLARAIMPIGQWVPKSIPEHAGSGRLHEDRSRLCAGLQCKTDPATFTYSASQCVWCQYLHLWNGELGSLDLFFQ